MSGLDRGQPAALGGPPEHPVADSLGDGSRPGGGGGHGTRVAIPSGQLMPLPDNLSFTEGGAIP